MRTACTILICFALTWTAPLAAQEQNPPAKTPAKGPAKAASKPGAETKTSQTKTTDTREPGLYMKFDTEKGPITCKFYEQEAPVTVGKIVGLALGRISYRDPKTKQIVRGKRFYDGLIFHRVIPNFMIQGGDPLGTGMGGPEGPGFPFNDEFSPSLKFDVPGRLAMANSGPNTNGSQFFITEVPTPHLNGRHTIFGQCGNLDLVKAIARVPTRQDSEHQNMPVTPVHMKVTIERVGPVPANAPESGRAKAPAKSRSKAPNNRPS